MSELGVLPYVPLVGLLLLAAVIDARHRRIPNWLTFGMILSGLLKAATFPGPTGFWAAVAGVFAGGAVPFVLFALGALGGGDVKLLAGVGAWLGPQAAVVVFVVECVVGLALVLCQCAAQGRTVVLFRNTAALACSIAHQGVVASAPGGKSFTSVDRPLPYAVPVAIATLLVLGARVGWRIV